MPHLGDVGVFGETAEFVDEDVPDVLVLTASQKKNLELVGNFLSEATDVVFGIDVIKGGLGSGWFNAHLVIEGADGVGWENELDFVESAVDWELLLVDDLAIFPKVDDGVLFFEGTDISLEGLGPVKEDGVNEFDIGNGDFVLGSLWVFGVDALDGDLVVEEILEG